jgi:hypothetical protein
MLLKIYNLKKIKEREIVNLTLSELWRKSADSSADLTGPTVTSQPPPLYSSVNKIRSET